MELTVFTWYSSPFDLNPLSKEFLDFHFQQIFSL